MTSILTNGAAMAALQTLRSINTNLKETQDHVSSGLRVGSASDNAAYWSIATTMRSDNGALSAVSDALGLGAAKVDTAYSGMSAAIDVVTQIKSKLVAATEQGVDKAKIQEEIGQLQGQLKSVAESASFNGQNWIMGAAGNKTVVTGFTRDANNNVTVQTSTYTLDDTITGNVLFGATAAGAIDTTKGILGTNGASGVSVFNLDATALDYTPGSVAANSISAVIQEVDKALQAMTSAGAQLGSMSTRIDLQTDFVSKLSDSIDSGIGKLVDADMEEESSRLTALQTQQQLGVQSLSIANSSSQNILSLFRS
jgi:flagellin